MKTKRLFSLSLLVATALSLSSCEASGVCYYQEGKWVSTSFSYAEGDIYKLNFEFSETDEKSELYSWKDNENGSKHSLVYYEVGVLINDNLLPNDDAISFNMTYKNSHQSFAIYFAFNEYEYRFRGYFKEKKDETFITGEFELAAEDENGLIYYPYGSIELNLYLSL